jgi:DNA invertase Pin-like site-specific DNA recombinase
MRTNVPMPVCEAIRAAQYVRMSTDLQQYSIDNQKAAIQQYAEQHGFVVVKTYADAGRSGIVLKRRGTLTELLKDVLDGNAGYRAILVYDVSRWGRFQDADEAAHYEFLCKSAGVPFHYCTELFPNDGTLPKSIFKALKRGQRNLATTSQKSARSPSRCPRLSQSSLNRKSNLLTRSTRGRT